MGLFDLNRHWDRRAFLRNAGAATLSALAAGPSRRAGAADAESIPASADQMILIWLAGGMAHTDSFDPKPYIPFEAGMDRRRIASVFPSIPTAVDGLRISEGFERIAAVMDRGACIRSVRPEAPGGILTEHPSYQYWWHTGYFPPITVAAPHIGSVIARTLGPKEPDVPAFVDIGQDFPPGNDGMRAFHSAGFLGSEYGPLIISNPADAAKVVHPAPGVSAGRFQNRRKLHKDLLAASPIGEFGSDFQKESLLRAMEGAAALMDSPAAKAFDCSLEPEATAAPYNVSHFGRACLLTRRLVEAGVRFVEVTTSFEGFKYWDTHFNGVEMMREMKAQSDGPIAQLVLDLEARGILGRTLVVIATEFSRCTTEAPAVIEAPGNYGLHGHYNGVATAVVFGGGFKKGLVFGATSDEPPCPVVEKPIRLEDLHATLYHAMGIPSTLSYETEGRPFRITKDGLGKPVKELLA